MACLVDESTFVRPIGRFALHDAIETGDSAALTDILGTFERQMLSTTTSSETPLTHISLDDKDPLGATPLHTALLYSNLDALRRLIVAGAKLDIKCSGSPPLHVALTMASLPTNAPRALAAVRMLLASGVDATALDDYGRSWVHVAAEIGSVELADTLRADARAATVSVDAADRTGMTPLGVAAMFRNGAMLHWLLGLGADPSISSSLVGDSPVHIAAARGWEDGLQALKGALLARGGGSAALETRNDAGLTAAECFVRHTAPGMAGALILTHEACAQHQTSETTDRG